MKLKFKNNYKSIESFDEKDIEDYPIFMAVSQNLGKDNSGKEIYELDENGERKLNEHGHLIQKHDLKRNSR